MPPTILQEKALKPETLPWISSIFSALLIISIATLSIIYAIDWFDPILSTQVVAVPNACSPVRFKCAGCTNEFGCTLVAHGPNTVRANSHLNLLTNNFVYIPIGAIVTLNLCAGSTESILISFNTTSKSTSRIGLCKPNLTEITLVGYLETSPNVWSPLNTFYDNDYYTHIIEYAMWKTYLFSNGTTIRYQDNIILPAPTNYCFSASVFSANTYLCSAIRMSMISWSAEQSRLGFLTLVGIVGGLSGIIYRLSFWFLLFLRRLQSRFFSDPPKSLLQTEFI